MSLVDYSHLLILFVVLLGSLAMPDAAQAWWADVCGDPTPAREGRLSLSPAVHVDPVGTVLFPVLSFAVDMQRLDAAAQRKSP